MKTVRVVAAVIQAVNDKNEPVIFATQRGYGEYKDGWEFPGGVERPKDMRMKSGMYRDWRKHV